MPRLTAWWERRSDPARVELYTRWSFHLFTLIEVGLVEGILTGAKADTGLLVGWFVLAVAHAGLCAVLCSRALDWLLERRGRPDRLLLAVTVLSVGLVVTTLALCGHGAFANSTAAFLVVTIASFGLGAAALCVRARRQMLYLLSAATGGTNVVALALGVPGYEASEIAISVLLVGCGLVATYGLSAWLLQTVWELEAARGLETRLAVAEERLRFGRDLHDVLGRNLAVIALKSELAVQLARRGRPEAVEQMIEVQRIAHESQREVREVVRGYRDADLAVELAGALSVLRAAGVESRAEVGDATGLPPEVQAALGWVIREATTNVLRHSDASRCTIRLSAGPPVRLAIENDGVPAQPPSTAGAGLAGLRERLATLGGTLSTESRSGTFRLAAEVPEPAVPALLPAPGRRPAGPVPSAEATS